MSDLNPTITEITTAAEHFRRLMLSPEPTAMEALFSDKLTYGHANGRVQTRAEFIGAMIHKNTVFNDIKITEQTICVSGDTAIVRHRFDADAISAGKATKPHIAVVQCWQKQNGSWRLLDRQGFNT